MGRTVSFVLDDKAVDVEREKLLDLEDPLQFSEKQDFTEKLESASSISPLGLLPSLKDIVKTVLFCGVTVFGISLFSNAIPIIGWHNVRSPTIIPLSHILIGSRSPSSAIMKRIGSTDQSLWIHAQPALTTRA